MTETRYSSHFRKRLKERWNVEITHKVYEQLCEDVESGRNCFVKNMKVRRSRDKFGRTMARAELHFEKFNLVIPVLWDIHRRYLVTALPGCDSKEGENYED